MSTGTLLLLGLAVLVIYLSSTGQPVIVGQTPTPGSGGLARAVGAITSIAASAVGTVAAALGLGGAGAGAAAGGAAAVGAGAVGAASIGAGATIADLPIAVSAPAWTSGLTAPVAGPGATATPLGGTSTAAGGVSVVSAVAIAAAAFVVFNVVARLAFGTWEEQTANWNEAMRAYGAYLDALHASDPDLETAELLPGLINQISLAVEGMSQPWQIEERAALLEQIAAWRLQLADAQARLLSKMRQVRP